MPLARRCVDGEPDPPADRYRYADLAHHDKDMSMPHSILDLIGERQAVVAAALLWICPAPSGQMTVACTLARSRSRTEASRKAMMGDNLTNGPIRALLVAPTPDGTWLREIRLPFPPFPGLGIRLDVYDMVNVESVEVGDDDRWDVHVTCFVSWEGGPATERQWEQTGFEQGVYV